VGLGERCKLPQRLQTHFNASAGLKTDCVTLKPVTLTSHNQHYRQFYPTHQ